MCGIAGEVSYSQDLTIREHDFLRMQQVLAPRGPDQKGLYLSGNAALVHRRLAVIDIEGGRQPMRAFADGNEYVIVYNGELYNTDEVRRLLLKRGASFETRSDTEAVLKAFISFGEKCVDLFNGIFAFAVWDAKKERLFAARDPIGVKPFFFSVKNGNFISESHTDFIFTIAGEELGFVGCVIIIILLLLIVAEVMLIAKNADTPAGRSICVGFATMYAMQTFINIAVATWMMPNTGLPLPFISYGLSSIISMYISIGIVLNIGLQRPQKKKNDIIDI